jgi:hypothetical protein
MLKIILSVLSVAALPGCIGGDAFTDAPQGSSDPVVVAVVEGNDAGVVAETKVDAAPTLAPATLVPTTLVPTTAATVDDPPPTVDAGPPAPDACVLVDKVKTCEGSCNANFDDGCGHQFTCPPCSPTPPSACVAGSCPACVTGHQCCGAFTQTGCGCTVYNDGTGCQ